MDKILNIGIIGCSTISQKSTIPAILKSKNAKLTSIGSRTIEKAKKVAKNFGCSKFGTYEDVLNDDEIDVVYISTPIGNHQEWVIKAALAKKHILCEKSSTDSFSSAKTMVKTSKENNVRLMEGFMYRFHSSHAKVKNLIQNGVIGKPFLFSSRYGFPPISKENIRFDKSLGGGVLNDAGCYPINASLMLFESEPKEISCKLIQDEEKKVDVKASIILNFENGIQSQLNVGYELFYQSVYSIWGSEGFLKLSRAYNVPPNMHVKLELDSNNSKEVFKFPKEDHFQIMIEKFCNEIQYPNSALYDFEKDLIKQAKIMEAARISSNENRIVEINEIK